MTDIKQFAPDMENSVPDMKSRNRFIKFFELINYSVILKDFVDLG